MVHLHRNISKDIAKDSISGFNDNFKASKESGEVDSNFANFKEGLKGAKDGALGSMAGKFDEAILHLNVMVLILRVVGLPVNYLID